jgi:AcrR family transcriptional regulator
MKVSKDKKGEIKKELIKAAVEIMTEKGFHAATMREISAKAGYGSATIYHYFPNKEKILYAYFNEKQDELVKLLDEVPDFTEFTLKEKLQIQLESLLDLYLQDREFVQEAYKMMFDSPLRTFTEFMPIKEKFIKTTNEFFEESIRKNEIQDYVYKNLISNLYWDYTVMVILYWYNDKSTGFTNTSQFIDMSLDIIVEILRNGIIVKFANIASFIFKNHIYTNIQSVNKLFPMKDVFQNVFKHSSLNKAANNGRESHGQTKRSTKRKD